MKKIIGIILLVIAIIGNLIVVREILLTNQAIFSKLSWISLATTAIIIAILLFRKEFKTTPKSKIDDSKEVRAANLSYWKNYEMAAIAPKEIQL